MLPGPGKVERRPQHKSQGSEYSTKSYSSTSTAASSLYDWPYIDPPKVPKKPWAIKALKELGIKVKGSPMFKKSKEFPGGKRPSICKEDIRVLGREDLDDFPDIPVLDISAELVAATKEALLEKEEELDLLPDFPKPKEYRMDRNSHQMRRMSPQPGPGGFRLRSDSAPDLRTACRRSGSTPNLLAAAAAGKRDSTPGPFYLEDLIKKFPKPPDTISIPRIIVSPPEEGADTTSPRLRCTSDASLLTSTSRLSPGPSGYGKHKPSSIEWVPMPVEHETVRQRNPRLAPKASLPSLPRTGYEPENLA